MCLPNCWGPILVFIVLSLANKIWTPAYTALYPFFVKGKKEVDTSPKHKQINSNAKQTLKNCDNCSLIYFLQILWIMSTKIKCSTEQDGRSSFLGGWFSKPEWLYWRSKQNLWVCVYWYSDLVKITGMHLCGGHCYGVVVTGMHLCGGHCYGVVGSNSLR